MYMDLAPGITYQDLKFSSCFSPQFSIFALDYLRVSNIHLFILAEIIFIPPASINNFSDASVRKPSSSHPIINIFCIVTTQSHDDYHHRNKNASASVIAVVPSPQPLKAKEPCKLFILFKIASLSASE